MNENEQERQKLAEKAALCVVGGMMVSGCNDPRHHLIAAVLFSIGILLLVIAIVSEFRSLSKPTTDA